MSAQAIQTTIISEPMLLVLQRLSPEQLQQVMDFAQFLAQHHNSSDQVLDDAQPQNTEGLDDDAQPQNWVEEASGSLKDVPEFDVAIAYGRAIRAENYSGLVSSI
jgi:hypothetical protein